MSTPNWALTIAYWLHMLATVVWIGSLFTLSFLILPVARQSLEAKDLATLISKIQKRFNPIAWFSLLLLLASGMVQLSANPNYKGFLVVEDRWSSVILFKHILFFITILVSAYMTWFLLPKIRRMAIMRKNIKADDEIATQKYSLEKQETILLNINLILAIIILALTAIARTS